MSLFEFDPNQPPPMPLSALLYCPTFMRLVRWHAPGMLYGIGRDARRDARQTALWIRWALIQWDASVRWLEMNPSPIFVLSARVKPFPRGES